MQIIAHRGASGYAPENTASAIKKAIEMGADMVEFDVHALPSGEVVLMHDRRLDRTTDGTGYLLRHSFEDLRQFNAGPGEPIPTLEEVLDLVNRRVPVDIELKGPDSAEAVANTLKAYLNIGWEPADFLVSSFDHPNLQKFKTLMPEIEVAALQDSLPLDNAAFAVELNADTVCQSGDLVNEAYVEDAHARGLRVFVFTVNDPEEVERICSIGVDGIFTDYPDVAREAAETYAAGLAVLSA